MKKEIIILISVIILLSFYYTNPNDFLNSITGMAVSGGIKLNITYQNSAPVIYNVTNPGTQSITEAGVTNVTFWFRVNEPNGLSDLVNASSYGELNKTGEVRRINTSCATSNYINATVMEYQCRIVGLWWFDGSGTWSINASIRDSAGNLVINNSAIFTVSPTTAFAIGPNAINWGDIRNSSVNVTPTDDPVLFNNTGNMNINNIQLDSYNLMGEINSSQFISVRNFTVDLETGGSPPLECSVNASLGDYLTNETDPTLPINGATAPRGNFTINYGNDTSAQEKLYFCINFITSNASSGQADLSEQSYSSYGDRAWIWST